MSQYVHDLLVAAEHLVGFVIVMLTLCLLWGLTALMGRLLGRPAATTPSATAAAASPPAVPTVAEDDVVVIAAAVAAMIDGRHRVVAVRPLPSSWGQQGRRDIHASHRIR